MNISDEKKKMLKKPTWIDITEKSYFHTLKIEFQYKCKTPYAYGHIQWSLLAALSHLQSITGF